jgi:hypothetical protein
MNTVTGWYFSEESRLLRHGDGRPIALGVMHEVDAPIELCKRGLHASVREIDALDFAPGPIVWRVELSGEIKTGDDKCVATHRKYIGGGVDASAVMRAFARRCALDVAHLWDMPPLVRSYLETGEESIRDAASRLAWSADARSAARAAARVAAWDAARAAARAAARDAARAAAWDAASDAAAWDAAWDAASDAASDAAWDAARDAQNKHLETMLMEICK